MHIILRSRAGDRDLDVDVRDETATIADVMARVQPDRVPHMVVIGDRAIRSTTSLVGSGLHEGAVLAMRMASPPMSDAAPSDRRLTLLTGTAAGTAYPLPLGDSIVIPARNGGLEIVPAAKPAPVSGLLRMRVGRDGRIEITDLGSSGGTVIGRQPLAPQQPVPVPVHAGTVIRLGDLHVTVRPERTDDRPRNLDFQRNAGITGTVSFNRPPRPRPAPSRDALDVPSAPTPRTPPQFSIASLLSPLVMGLVTFVVLYLSGATSSIAYVAVGVLAPLTTVGLYLENRHRYTKGQQTDAAKVAEDLTDFRGRVADAALRERQRRRELLPDLAETVRRAELPSVRLWERRARSEDFLQLSAGIADVPWRPALATQGPKLPEGIGEVLAGTVLVDSPVGVDLSEGFIGVVGDRAAALAVARSLVCQAAVHHGPADLTIGVFVDEGHKTEWEWTKWLPHTRSQGAGRWLSASRPARTSGRQGERTPDSSQALLAALAGGAGQGALFVILDSDRLIAGQQAPARALLEQSGRPDQPSGQPRRTVTGVVVAQTEDALPSACAYVLYVSDDGSDSLLRHIATDETTSGLSAAGLSTSSAASCAKSVARFDDPALTLIGGSLPKSTLLLPLLELDPLTTSSIRRRWRQNAGSTALLAPIGVDEQGEPFVLDLVHDGSHGLIGGTTGSGKSELLRSLVVALAANTDPDHLTFALIDFKGGATFDACSQLPHTVGVVTDVDDEASDTQLFAALWRVLRSLEAELGHRERLLRSVRADNLRQYLASNLAEPLPRLVIVVDEFGAMHAKLGDKGKEFLSALVGVAQRGRTLGVHMILAAQQPAPVVDDKIKTNTNLRIALRVQDAQDSSAVIDSDDAAQISRDHPGRAYVRLGPGEVVAIQTALVTYQAGTGDDGSVVVADFVFGPTETTAHQADDEGTKPIDGKATDLARLVDTIVAASEADGYAPPRKVWPEPLPDRLDLGDPRLELPPERTETTVGIALAEDPEHQRQLPVGWDLTDGNLILAGVAGSGTTTGLVSLALTLTSRLSPQELELYAFDFGAGDLAVLERLPHTGTVVTVDDRERQTRLIRHLRTELAARRTDPARAQGRRMLVLIDNVSELKAQYANNAYELLADLTRTYADGPQLGISFAVAADRWSAVPPPWIGVTPQRWLFRMGEVHDYGQAGLSRPDTLPNRPGRAIMAPADLTIQLARPATTVTEAVNQVNERWAGVPGTAAAIGSLPPELTFASLGVAADVAAEPWRIPVGLGEAELSPVGLELYDDEHALVTGPARSGKSLTLWTIAESLRAGASPSLTIFGVGSPRSPLGTCPAIDHYASEAGAVTTLFSQVLATPGSVCLLVDDAHGFEDGDEAISRLIATKRPGFHVVAAANSDSLRPKYNHWARKKLEAKTGVLLRPNPDTDGEWVGATVPRQSRLPMVTGRGYVVVNGEAQLAQVALPTEPSN